MGCGWVLQDRSEYHLLKPLQSSLVRVLHHWQLESDPQPTVRDSSKTKFVQEGLQSPIGASLRLLFHSIRRQAHTPAHPHPLLSRSTICYVLLASRGLKLISKAIHFDPPRSLQSARVVALAYRKEYGARWS